MLEVVKLCAAMGAQPLRTKFLLSHARVSRLGKYERQNDHLLLQRPQRSGCPDCNDHWRAAAHYKRTFSLLWPQSAMWVLRAISQAGSQSVRRQSRPQLRLDLASGLERAKNVLATKKVRRTGATTTTVAACIRASSVQISKSRWSPIGNMAGVLTFANRHWG